MCKATLIIPIKKLCNCKTRLSTTLPPKLRVKLSLSMLKDIIDSAFNSRFIENIVVVSQDPAELSLGSSMVRVIKDYWGREDLAVYKGIEYSVRVWGSREIVVCVSDAPLISPVDFDVVVEALGYSDIVLSPSLDGGTNIIAFKPPLKITLAYGYMSFYKHYNLSLNAGLKPAIYASARASIDIDTRGDLAQAYKLCVRDNALSSKRTCRILSSLRGVFIEDNNIVRRHRNPEANRGFQATASR